MPPRFYFHRISLDLDFIFSMSLKMRQVYSQEGLDLHGTLLSHQVLELLVLLGPPERSTDNKSEFSQNVKGSHGIIDKKVLGTFKQKDLHWARVVLVVPVVQHYLADPEGCIWIKPLMSVCWSLLYTSCFLRTRGKFWCFVSRLNKH